MLLRYINSIYNLFHRRGLSYLRYLISGVFVPKAVYNLIYTTDSYRLRRIIQIVSGSFGLLTILLIASLEGWSTSLWITSGVVLTTYFGFRLAQIYEIHRLHRKAVLLTCEQRQRRNPSRFTLWSRLQVAPDTRRAVDAAWHAHHQDELLLGQIDQDGRVLGIFGQIPGTDMVLPEDFLPRKRYKLDIVLCDGYVLLCKDYGRDFAGFVREWCSLLVLEGKANVPAVYKLDEVDHKLFMNFIPGRTVRDALVEAGAKIRDVQVMKDPELVALNPTRRASQVAERGRALVPGCLDKHFLVQMEEQINRIHACGIASLDVKYGNVIIHPDDGSPWFVDFENVRLFGNPSSLEFLYKRDRDRQKINYLFHCDFLIETSARELLNKQGLNTAWYAPLDFGNGLTVGSFWSTDTGMGRWEYLNKSVMVPIIRGKRILDLGSNNGTMPVMMLRSGAREVVGLELSPVETERAAIIKRIFEWRDMRKYDLIIHNFNMLEVLHRDLGRFDLVTAFCSLYYLEEEQMKLVVRRAAELAPVMVLQANTSSQQNPHKHFKASVSYLKRLLEENGFHNVQVFMPPKYDRPLLIGKQTSCL